MKSIPQKLLSALAIALAVPAVAQAFSMSSSSYKLDDADRSPRLDRPADES